MIETYLELARLGQRFFTAPPALRFEGTEKVWDPRAGTGGYALPDGWQETSREASTQMVEDLQEKHALCLVTGVAFDVLEYDEQAGGRPGIERLWREGVIPRIYGVARSPSGGKHLFIRAIGHGNVHGRLATGVDYKGRAGMVFVAPTQKLSKTTGKICQYVWEKPLDMAYIRDHIAADKSGKPLYERIERLRRPKLLPLGSKGAGATEGALAGLCKTVASAAEGERNSVASWAGFKAGQHGWTEEEAGPPLIEAAMECGLPETEATTTVLRGIRDGHGRQV